MLYAAIPLVLVLGTVELGSALMAAHIRRSRDPTAGFRLARLPARAQAETDAALTVVCVGDSWTFGWGVEPEEAYPSRLEQMLRPNIDADVINLGNPGASPIRAARALTAWLAKGSADVVVYLAGSNTPMNRVTLEDRHAPASLRAMRPLLRHLASYRLLSQIMARARVEADGYLRDWDPEAEQQRVKPADHREWQENALASARANMARMADLSETFGFNLLVLTYGLPPSMDTHRGESWYRFPILNETIRMAAAENGLDVVDVEAAYLRRGVAGPELLYHGDAHLDRGYLDIHPNAAGYDVHAEEVAAWIVEHAP